MKNEQMLLSEKVVKYLPFTKYFFDKFPWLAQFINFSVVGVINLFLSYFLYAGCIWVGLHHQIANQISFWISVLNGYLLNKYWVFQKANSGRGKAEASKYFAVYGFNFVLGIFLLYLYVDVLQISKYLAPIISIPITVPMNYLLNRYWVFKKNNI